MTLIETNLEILAQLKTLLKQFNNEQYTQSLHVLSNNTIGKHVRHVVEFYECLLKGIQQNEINYDNRDRNLSLENDVFYTLNLVEDIEDAIKNQTTDIPINLVVQYKSSEKILVNSTYFRELIYNIEHAIHHFAILAIAVKTNFPNITLVPNFGTAYSTIQFQEKQCAQ